MAERFVPRSETVNRIINRAQRWARERRPDLEISIRNQLEIILETGCCKVIKDRSTVGNFRPTNILQQLDSEALEDESRWHENERIDFLNTTLQQFWAKIEKRLTHYATNRDGTANFKPSENPRDISLTAGARMPMKGRRFLHLREEGWAAAQFIVQSLFYEVKETRRKLEKIYPDLSN